MWAYPPEGSASFFVFTFDVAIDVLGEFDVAIKSFNTSNRSAWQKLFRMKLSYFILHCAFLLIRRSKLTGLIEHHQGAKNKK